MPTARRSSTNRGITARNRRIIENGRRPNSSFCASDDYWAATDKELVSLGGSFGYCSWLLCGGRQPALPVPEIRNSHRPEYNPNIGSVVYVGEHFAGLYGTAIVQQATSISGTSTAQTLPVDPEQFGNAIWSYRF